MNIKSGYKSINGDYIFAKIAKKAQEYKKKHPSATLINLGVGDVCFTPSKSLCENLIGETEYFSTEQGFCGYPDERGIEPLRKKISEYYFSLGAKVLPDEIFITTGAKPALGELFEICYFNKASIVVPTYPLYQELCDLHFVDYLLIKSNNKNAYPLPKEQSDVVFLCSPNNPTGTILSANAIKKYITYAKNNDSLIVIDGAYVDFSKKYICPYSFSGSENIVEVRSYSKNLCFTGLRCGYVVIKKQNSLYDAYKRYLTLRSNGVNVIIQKTAISSYNEKCKKEEWARIEYYKKNAKILKKALKSVGYNVKGGENAPYLLVEVKESTETFCDKLLNDMQIIATPGEAFNAPNQIRFSCLARREDILEGAKRIISSPLKK